MTESKAGYSLNPTIGVSAGLVHTDVPYRRVVLAPDGETGAVVSGAPSLPATAFALSFDYPLAQAGPFIWAPGIQGGATRWGQYDSRFGSIYSRFGIDFGHDYFSLGARLGYGGFSTRHNDTETVRHGVDVAGDVIIQPSRRVGIQVTGGGRIEWGGHSQTFILGGLTVRLGSLSSVDPADLASGVRALGSAQTKHAELEALFKGMTQHLIQYYSLDGDNAELAFKINAVERYVDWITKRNTSANFAKPALDPFFMYIDSALTYANKAIPSPHPYKDAEVEKIKTDLEAINTKMAQPALDLLFFMHDSIFGDLLQNARTALREIANKDSVNGLKECVGYGQNLYDVIQSYNKLKPLMNAEQDFKVSAMVRHLNCLHTGSMCHSGTDLSLTLPSVEGELRKVLTKETTCRHTNGNGAKGAPK